MQSGQVSGLLLYAQVGEESMPILDAKIGGNRIMVRSLDLNQRFDNIRSQLNGVIQEVFE